MIETYKNYQISLKRNTAFFVASDLRRVIQKLDGRKLLFYPRKIEQAVNDLGLTGISLHPLSDGEELKSISGIQGILKVMMRENPARSDYIIALGGGSITDAVAFSASLYKRGIRLVNIPTTLLGMVDAAIGGKTGINFLGKKNMIGTFYFPDIVIACLQFVATLPEDSYRDGLVEMIKYGIIMDNALMEDISAGSDQVDRRNPEVLSRLISRSVENKMNVVIQDPLEELGLRSILNYGHTIGHAIESASEYEISHGKAVSLGMVMEAMLAEEEFGVENKVHDEISSVLRRFALPTTMEELNFPLDSKKMKKAILHDKKSSGDAILMPVVEKIGSSSVRSVKMSILEEFVDRKF